jgi:hypothetical protein
MSDVGMKVSKSGHSVTENDRYMLFTSKYPLLKRADSGQGTLSTTSGSGGATVEITHNLGYVPVCMVTGQWVPESGTAVGSRFSNWSRWIYQGVQESDLYYYYADTTKLYITVSLSSLTDVRNYSFNYQYHIFYDEDELA